MGLLRWILLAALVYFAWHWWRVKYGRARRARQAGQSGGRQGGRMVRCARCGLYLPQQEAVPAGERYSGERYYCSEPHRAADRGA